MTKKMITTLAKSRLLYNKNRTLLTVIAVTFTTILLMALGTSAVGLIDIERKQAVLSGNQHASFQDLTGEQLELLENHMDVEALETMELFASVEYGKMNGYLQYRDTSKGEISHVIGEIIEGHAPNAPDEICGPKAFFERMDVEPVIGNTFSIAFRPNGDGAVETKEFTICGFVSQIDLSKIDINDTRLAYSAYISEALVQEYIPSQERLYRVNLRVNGQDTLNYDEIKERIQDVAKDVGYDPEKIDYNIQYLVTMTSAGTEMVGIIAGLGTMIVVFSGLVIYSIYYVSVITDVQELGKLKALGASRKQIKQLLLREGMAVTMIALPIGLIIGFLVPYLILPVFANKATAHMASAFTLEKISMFSLPVTFTVILVVLFTVYISLLKPMRMASRISPIEAVRYQESSANNRKIRKGHETVNVTRLCIANLTRNRKRTVVTLMTMGLSCVLFMSLAGLMNSMSPEDIARRTVEVGDFHISLNFSQNDKVYPENNLDSMQLENYFNEELLDRIQDIEGVTDIQHTYTILVGADYDSEMFEDGARATMSPLTREQAEKYSSETGQGTIDYDQMVNENGVIFTSNYFIDEYGFAIGDILPLTIYDGKRLIPLDIQIEASIDTGDSAYFLIPQEIWDSLELTCNATTDLFISVDKDKYNTAKNSIQQIVNENPYFILYSIDEERSAGVMAVGMVKYPLYAILIIIAVIGFINLINTMITSIVTRKRELGILQAVGLSNRQMIKMLAGEGMFFVAGTLLISVTLGNFLGYLIFLWGKDSHFMSVTAYHYPLWETIGLLVVLLTGQMVITLFISKRMHRESLVDRIRSSE